MNSEQIQRAAMTMQVAAEQMERVYQWWSQEQQRAYERNVELVAQLEAIADRVVKAINERA
jgi:hypothetical protein